MHFTRTGRYDTSTGTGYDDLELLEWLKSEQNITGSPYQDYFKEPPINKKDQEIKRLEKEIWEKNSAIDFLTSSNNKLEVQLTRSKTENLKQKNQIKKLKNTIYFLEIKIKKLIGRRFDFMIIDDD